MKIILLSFTMPWRICKDHKGTTNREKNTKKFKYEALYQKYVCIWMHIPGVFQLREDHAYWGLGYLR